jgi:VanZ family protein
MFAPWKRQLVIANLLYAVALLCLGILPDLPSAGISDHTAHALAYGIQAGLLSAFFLSSRSRVVSALLAAVITIVWGAVIEALQLVQSARSFEFSDLAANAAGAVVAISIVLVVTGLAKLEAQR